MTALLVGRLFSRYPDGYQRLSDVNGALVGVSNEDGNIFTILVNEIYKVRVGFHGVAEATRMGNNGNTCCHWCPHG